MRYFNILFEEAIDGLRSLSQETRRWLNSPKTIEPSVRPITRLQTDTALVRYASYFQRLLYYSIRLWAAD